MLKTREGKTSGPGWELKLKEVRKAECIETGRSGRDIKRV
jgi:hypothetical protein